MSVSNAGTRLKTYGSKGSSSSSYPSVSRSYDGAFSFPISTTCNNETSKSNTDIIPHNLLSLSLDSADDVVSKRKIIDDSGVMDQKNSRAKTSTKLNQKKSVPLQDLINAGAADDIEFLQKCVDEYNPNNFYSFKLHLPTEWSALRDERCRAWLYTLGFAVKIISDTEAFSHQTLNVSHFITV